MSQFSSFFTVPVPPTKRPAEESDDLEKKRQKFEEEKVQRDKERFAAKLDGAKSALSAPVPAAGAE